MMNTQMNRRRFMGLVGAVDVAHEAVTYRHVDLRIGRIDLDEFFLAELLAFIVS